MSHNSTHHNLHITLAALIVPTLIVAVAPRLTAIPGPSAAIATPTPEAESPLPTAHPTTTKLTEAQHAAIARRQSLTSTRPANPFHYPTPQTSIADPYGESSTPDTTSAANAPPTMLITSIAAAQGRGIAIINGTLRNEGDTIADGWTITSINPTTRTVTIEHTDGTTHSESQTR